MEGLGFRVQGSRDGVGLEFKFGVHKTHSTKLSTREINNRPQK